MTVGLRLWRHRPRGRRRTLAILGRVLSDTGRGGNGGRAPETWRRRLLHNRLDARRVRSGYRDAIGVDTTKAWDGPLAWLRLAIREGNATPALCLPLLAFQFLLTLLFSTLNHRLVELLEHRSVACVSDILGPDYRNDRREESDTEIVVEDGCAVEWMTDEDETAQVDLRLLANVVRDCCFEFAGEAEVGRVNFGKLLGGGIRFADVPFEGVGQVERADGDVKLLRTRRSAG